MVCQISLSVVVQSLLYYSRLYIKIYSSKDLFNHLCDRSQVSVINKAFKELYSECAFLRRILIIRLKSTHNITSGGEKQQVRHI